MEARAAASGILVVASWIVALGGCAGKSESHPGQSGAWAASGAGTGGGGAGGAGAGGGGFIDPSVGGAPGVCPDSPPLDARRCVADEDCAIITQNRCTRTRALGVGAGYDCLPPATPCLPGAGFVGYQTDTEEITLDEAAVKVRCEFGEPGAGLCTTYVMAVN